MDSFPIIRVVTKLIIPYILLFGFYVQFHGDFGPGGGFQAGVILASGLILYGLVFGLPAVKSVMPPKWVEKLIALGVLIYAGTGVVTMLAGPPAHDTHVHHSVADHGVADHGNDPTHEKHSGRDSKSKHDSKYGSKYANFLDYDALEHSFLPGILPHGQHLGIFVIELGVGITVTAVMTMIFYCFAGRHVQPNVPNKLTKPDSKRPSPRRKNVSSTSTETDA
jgi:multicomponent Na+:H+ antiporter subunit B